MHRLFDERRDWGGGFNLPEFSRIRAGLQLSVRQVIEYRQANPRGMLGPHLLVDLLMNLNISLGYELDFYVSRVEAVALNRCVPLKMTSAWNRGRVFDKGVFYVRPRQQARLREVVIATTDSFDLKDFQANWRTYDPVRVMYHPMTDLNLTVPDGYQTFDGEGVAVFTVNVPMLAAQYYLWRKERQRMDEAYGSRTVEQFLQEVPLPNMLYTQTDIAVMNRLMCKFFGLPVAQSQPRHPFALAKWDDRLDRAQEQILSLLLPKRLDIDTLLARIPTVFARNYHEIIRLPEAAFTKQIQWAILLARLPLLAFLVIQNKRFENERNRHFLNRLRLYLRVVEYDRTLQAALPKTDFDNAMSIIEHGIWPFL